MKAIVVTADHKTAIVNKELRKIGPNEALLKMICCGVCHTDMHVKNADYGDKTGRTLGHEGIGRVVEVGSNVTTLKVGDRASVAWFFKGCGYCEYCTSGKETICRNAINAGYTVDGAMAEYTIVVADYAVKVPTNLESAPASSITCAGVTTYKAIKSAKLTPNQWIVIFGLGGLGNLAVQYAKHVFGLKVIGVDINEGLCEFAKKSGADLTLNPLKCDAAQEIQKLIGGAHAVIVTAVSKTAFTQSVGMVRAAGKVVAVGLPPESMDLPISKIVFDEIKVMGSLVGSRLDLVEALQAGADGKVVPKYQMRPMEDINKIFKEMEEGLIKGRMVIDLGGK